MLFFIQMLQLPAYLRLEYTALGRKNIKICQRDLLCPFFIGINRHNLYGSHLRVEFTIIPSRSLGSTSECGQSDGDFVRAGQLHSITERGTTPRDMQVV